MKIKIDVEPRSKKNSQQIIYVYNKPRVIQSKSYLQFEKDCKIFLDNHKHRINYPINLKCKFYVKDRRRRDLANYIEAIQDVLVKYEVIADDNYNIVASLDGCSMQIDRKHPRIEIEIEKILD